MFFNYIANYQFIFKKGFSMKKIDQLILLFLSFGIWSLVIINLFTSNITWADRHQFDEIRLLVSDSCTVDVPKSSELPATLSINCF